MPKFSIITVAKNARTTISDTINSILSQTIGDYEHIIIDGGSDDGTVDIINTCSHKRLQLISEPDNGIYDAMNKGIALAKGDIIGFLNADDLYYDALALEMVEKNMIGHAVDACYADLLYVAKDNLDEVIRYWKSSTATRLGFYLGWIPPHPTFFVKRSVYEKYGNFRTDLGQAADYELMLRFMLFDNITSHYIPAVLVKMRTGGITNVTICSRFKNYRSTLRAWEVHGITPKPWTLFLRSIRKSVQYILPVYRYSKNLKPTSH